MNCRRIGSTGSKVDELRMGAMTFGRESAEAAKLGDRFVPRLTVVAGDVQASASWPFFSVRARGTYV